MKRNRVGEKPEYKNQEIKVKTSDDWKTPRPLFEKLNAEFDFQYDLAADEHNHLLPWYFSLQDDALKHDWKWNSFANIPYSNPKPWFGKAPYEVKDNGITVVYLAKVATSENYWGDAAKDMHVRFLRGRIKFWDEFNKPHYGATFPSAILIFSPETLGKGKMELWDYRKEIPEKIV